MALLYSEDEKAKGKAKEPETPKPEAAAKPGVGDVVLLHAEGQDPAPAVVLGEADGLLHVNDLSGQYGMPWVGAKDDDSDAQVLSWTAR